MKKARRPLPAGFFRLDRQGYTEAGIVAGTFNGIPNVQLVCLEKKV